MEQDWARTHRCHGLLAQLGGTDNTSSSECCLAIRRSRQVARLAGLLARLTPRPPCTSPADAPRRFGGDSGVNRPHHATGLAALTNSSVYVLVRSMDLPLTAALNAPRTARHVAGPSAGMTPVGLKIPFSLLSAAT